MDPEAVPLRPGKFDKGLVLQFLSGQYCGWPVVDSQGKTLGVVTDSVYYRPFHVRVRWRILE